MISKKDIIDTITLLKMSYPGALKEYGENELKMLIEVWFRDFQNVDKESFVKAIEEHRSTAKFFPSVADIKEKLAKQSMRDFPEAEDEWEEVRRAVRLYGSYRIQEAMESFKPYTRKIVEHIGFWNICQATQEEQKWNRKEFIEEYNTLKDKYTTELQIGNKEVNLLNG